MKIQHHLPFLCCIAVIFLSILPLIPVLMEHEGVHLTSSYYLEGFYVPLAKEVADGHPFVGNPFYFEHRNEIPVTFVLPYWIYAAPLVAGFPIAVASEINFTFWSIVFGIFVYLIMKKMGVSAVFASAGAVFAYIARYGDNIRPIFMEIANPMFLLFVAVFFLWWERSGSHRRDALLAFVVVCTTYGYTFSAQIVALFLLLVFICLLYMRDWTRVQHALLVGVYAFVLCIPYLMLTYAQLHHPYFKETMVRTGFGFTHVPSLQAALNLLHLIPLLLLVGCLWLWIYKNRKIECFTYIGLFLLLLVAIEIMSVLNVITGLDMETASHAWRFSQLWLVIATPVAAHYVYKAHADIFKVSFPKKLGIFLLVIIVGVTALHDIQFEATIFNFSRARASIQDLRSAMPTVQWLNEHEQNPVVVWTNPENQTLYSYLVDFTKHYMLSGSGGNLQIMSNDETEERYLVAVSLSNQTRESIARHVWDYDGVGAALDTPNTINRSVKMCRALHLQIFGFECGQIVSSDTLFATHFDELYQRYTKQIEPNLHVELKKFHVSYIWKDTVSDTNFHPERLSFAKKIFSDGRYELYKVE